MPPAFPLFLNSTIIHLPVSFIKAIKNLTFLVLCITATECKPSSNHDLVPAASNITLVLTKWFPPAVKVYWQLNQNLISNVKEVHVSYNPSKSSLQNVIKVNSSVNQILLNKLLPNQKYELELISIGFDPYSTNSSSTVYFISPSNESSPNSKFSYYTPYSQEEIRRKLQITMDEIVILIIVLVVWLSVICIFCSKWSKLRHLEPYHPDYRPPCDNSQHSPAFSHDSDNLANLGALTTTPVASGGGIEDLEDSEDMGLLVSGNTMLQGSDLDIQIGNNLNNVLTCNGLHVPPTSLFTHSNCPHNLDSSVPVCSLRGVLITEPSVDSSNMSLKNFNQKNLFNNQQSKDSCDTQISIHTKNDYDKTTLGLNKEIDFYTTHSDHINKNNSIINNQIKKQVQFQNIHSTTPYFSHLSGSDNVILQRAAPSTAAFILPVAVARPNLGDIYYHGSTFACGTNLSSIESNTSCNSCCLQNNFRFNHSSSLCPSLIESLEHETDHVKTDSNSKCSTLNARKSIDSIYIELPVRYHINSNISSNEDKFSKKHEKSLNENKKCIGKEKERNSIKKESNKNHLKFNSEQNINNLQKKLNLKSTKLSANKVLPKKSKSLTLIEPLSIYLSKKAKDQFKKIESFEIDKAKLIEKNKRLYQKKPKKHYKLDKFFYSAENIMLDDKLSQLNLIRHYNSCCSLKKKLKTSLKFSSQDYNQNLYDVVNEEYKKSKQKLAKKGHFRSDNLIAKKKRNLKSQFSDESTSSYSHHIYSKKLNQSFTDSDTSSSSFAPSSNYLSSESSEVLKNKKSMNKDIEETKNQNKTKFSEKLINSGNSTNVSTDNEKVLDDFIVNNSLKKSDKIKFYASSSEDSHELFFHNSTEDESLCLKKYKRLDSIIEQDIGNKSFIEDKSLIPKSQTAQSFKNFNQNNRMYQSVTMYNISSLTEKLNSLNNSKNQQNDNSNKSIQMPTIRRHQSAEQMLKKLINSFKYFYRKTYEPR